MCSMQLDHSVCFIVLCLLGTLLMTSKMNRVSISGKGIIEGKLYTLLPCKCYILTVFQFDGFLV